MALFFKELSQNEVDIPQQATVIRISAASNGAPKEVTVFSNKKPVPVCLPSSSKVNITEEPSSVLSGNGNKVYPVPVNIDNLSTRSVILQPKQRIPRPPNAFMLFANDWRRKLALQFPRESNKEISIRLGRMWKMMDKTEKDRYFQYARQVDAEHKKKFPDYVYNPKEARMRKALREQSRGERQQLHGGVAPPRWIKQPLSMNHRQAFVSPIMLAQQQRRLEESKTAIKEQVEWDNRMLQNFPDYLELPYSGLNIPSNPSDYAIVADVDTQSWYPYMQGSGQTETSYSTESKLPVDWSSQYNSDQQMFIRTSPQSSPFSLGTQQNVNNMILNGNHQAKENDDSQSTNCLTSDQKSQILTQSNECVVKAEQQVTDLLMPVKVVSENGIKVEIKRESDASGDSGNKDILRLPGFHQAFGSTEIGRFSQHDGFFEAATQPEPVPKVSTPPPPPTTTPKRGRAPRNSRKSKQRAEVEKWPDPCPPPVNHTGKKDTWSDWNPNVQQGCESLVSNQQRMNYYQYHDEPRPQINFPEPSYPQQWHQEPVYYDRPCYNQYYPPCYNPPPPPQEPVRNYHDFYPDYYYHGHNQNWRNHPYYNPSHFPVSHHHHQNVSYYQQYSEYRNYGYQNNRWAMNREIKYSSGMV